VLHEKLLILFYFIYIRKLRESAYLSSDQLNQAKSMFFTLCHILYNG